MRSAEEFTDELFSEMEYDGPVESECIRKIRKVQIDALKWVFEFEYDTMTEVRDKIKELETAK